ncbi:MULTISPECIES: hypothetical protein [unclassified Treponema]|uniref:hypothetical protein n=1 Tax=unclassified Treponema TaxID=2638727 RepID=UPI0020A59639|nr:MULTISPECIES: hypothetical protein [unclassified Treponema]UTC66495.1 hypothetical protein E4O06_11070 [Treponema sp. OMZ 789]UTC69227.1 hypothetical protein E4O01_11210 [Treponema sp. OMZ 790]UTC71940.1 hypothetical protein E4O02_11300 [Treponema sp. OMZ 791]
MNFKKAQNLLIASILPIISFSCSLNYSKEAQIFEKKPNFVFKNANLDQYEENSLNLRINFAKLEIYDTDKTWAGKNLRFFKIDKKSLEKDNPEAELKGRAGLIKIDEKNNNYFLGQKVFFEDLKEGLMISGEAFFWDKKENILYGVETGSVTVKQGDELYISGEGFIANTLSKEFEFLHSIEGKIKTKNEEKKNEEISESQEQ